MFKFFHASFQLMGYTILKLSRSQELGELEPADLLATLLTKATA